MREPVIVDVVRTTFGKRGGALANWHPADLLGFALTTLIERTGCGSRAHRRRHRRVREPGGGAEHEPRPQRVGLCWTAPVGAGHDRRPPVRFVPAGRALRRRWCGSGPLRPGDRLRCRGHEPGATGVQRAGRDGPFPPSFMEQVDGRLWTQFRVSQVLAERYGITRQEMDGYALESHRRSAESWDNGHFERRSDGGADQGGGRHASPGSSSAATKASAVPRRSRRSLRCRRPRAGSRRRRPTSPRGTRPRRPMARPPCSSPIVRSPRRWVSPSGPASRTSPSRPRMPPSCSPHPCR